MTQEPVSPLRRRMIEDMTIRQFGTKTQTDYVRVMPLAPCARTFRSSQPPNAALPVKRDAAWRDPFAGNTMAGSFVILARSPATPRRQAGERAGGAPFRRSGSLDYLWRMTETFFYHSFPRRAGVDQLKKGLNILGLIVDYGLVLAPEALHWEYPHANGAPPRPMDMAQRRICFTELTPVQLAGHA